MIRRRLLNTMFLLSTLSCLAVGLLWALSYNNREFWLADPLGGMRINSTNGSWAICVYDGNLIVNHYLNDPAIRPNATESGWHFREILGYRFYAGSTQKWSTFAIALWVVFSIFAVPPVGLSMHAIGRKFVGGDNAPLCRKCRYNLTANTSGVCPERGAPV